jgi:hypothetical protein
MVLDTNDLVAVVAACDDLLGSGEASVPSGYPDSLALCIIDAIWSMGVTYSSVVNVLDRYRTWVRVDRRDDPAVRSAAQLAADVADSGGPEAFARNVARNRNRTSPTGGVLKASAVADAASALSDLGVTTTADLRSSYRRGDLEEAWRSVKGQGSGISWHYLLILGCVPDVKADRMVCAFVARAVGRPSVASPEARDLLVAAHETLLRQRPNLDLRALDHAVWTAERVRRRG